MPIQPSRGRGAETRSQASNSPRADSDSDSFADQETISESGSEGSGQMMGSRHVQGMAHRPSRSVTFQQASDDHEGDDSGVERNTDGAGNIQDTEQFVGLREIGNLASWTVSTAKPGNGIEQLRDDDTSVFWQSDGPQPHHINIHFARRVKVKRMRMYLDFENDESYTPTKITVLSGTGYHDLCEVTKLDLERPKGWVEIPLDGVHADGELRTFLIQFAIHANHQNGKDTHVRGLQIFAAEPPAFEFGEIDFTSPRIIKELQLR